MRFMMLLLPSDYRSASAGGVPEASALEEMMKYNRSLQKAGVLLAGDGLHPPAMGARVSFGGGRSTVSDGVSDGPRTEAKEVVGGYWLLALKSKAEAIEWARRCPAADGDIIEIRQVHELADFPADGDATEGRPALTRL